MEPAFGQIKMRGFGRLSLRGLAKARGEWSLIALSHNLLKLHKARRGRGQVPCGPRPNGVTTRSMAQRTGTRFSCPLFSLCLAASIAVTVPACGYAPPEDVQGTAFRLTVSEEDLATLASRPWAGRQVEAIPLSPAGLGPLSAEIDATGSFRIPAVPAGPYWLAFPDEISAFPGDGAKVYALTEARSIDLSRKELGLGELPGRTLPIRITGLDPVQTEDHMEVYSSRHSWYSYWGPRPLGAEETPWPAEAHVPSLSPPSERLVAKQWRTEIRDGLHVQRTVRAGRVSVPAEDVQPLVVQLSSSLAQQLSFRVDHPGFLAALGAPPATPLSYSFSARADPDPKGETSVGGTALVKGSSLKTLTAEPGGPGIDYVDPYPKEWARRFRVAYYRAHTYELPSPSRQQLTCTSHIEATGSLAELGSDRVRPPLSLPSGLELDGRSALAELDSVPLTPSLRWQAPAGGRVSFYKVRITRLVELPARATPGMLAGTLLTTRTELRIPPGVLQPGGDYVLELIAVSESGEDLGTAPLRASLREPGKGSAQLCSARFRTSPR